MKDNNNMIPYLRHKRILDVMEKNEITTIEELRTELGGRSVSTIRRDLIHLEKQGQIILLRGGAAKMLPLDKFELSISKKLLLNVEAKERIAKYAASIVEDGDVIYIDSGTTPQYMLKYLKQKDITLVTTNMRIYQEENLQNFKVILVGGEINHALASTSGPITDNQLNQFFFEKAFLGANGFSEIAGINTFDTREKNKKQIVKQNAKLTYVLVDSSKAGKITLCKCLELDECTIITDKDNEIIQKYSGIVVES